MTLKLKETELYSELNVVERKREFKQCLYALLTKEHLLLKGKTGTGKSYFANNVFSLIKDARVFNIHLTKFISEEALFGPINIKKLREESIIEYNIKNSALEANLLYLDEFFDAPDVLLRTLLDILNERVWNRGQQQIVCPLYTAIATSNYKRENKITEAVLDRFIFKAEINPIKSKRLIKKMYIMGDKKIKKKLTLKELSEAIEQIDSNKIKIDDKIIELFEELRLEYIKLTNKYISDRTAKKSLKVLKASAFLNGRKNVIAEDLEELVYVFCTLNVDIEEQMFSTAFKKIVGSTESIIKINKEMDKIEKFIKDFPTDFSKITEIEFIKKMQKTNEYLALLVNINDGNEEMIKRKNKLLKTIKNFLVKNEDKFLQINSFKKINNKINENT